MNQKQLMRKAKQAARRETRKNLESIDREYVLQKFVKDKPKYIPQFVWNKILSVVIADV